MAFTKGSQNDRILRKLQNGPVTNSYMAHCMNILKYTSRISQLRAKGYVIIGHDLGGGLWKYVLMNKANDKT
jgi:hypothetical protein